MLKIRYKIFSLLISILLFNNFTASETTEDEAEPEKTLIQHVTDKYIQSNFPYPKPKKEEEKKGYINLLKRGINLQYPKQELFDLYTTAFNLMLKNNSFQTTIIDKSVVDKLEIVGGGEIVKANLFSKIFDKYIRTKIGTAFTVATFCHPTTDVETIKARQNRIVALIRHKNNLNNINSLLDEIKEHENKILRLYTSLPAEQQIEARIEGFIPASFFGYEGFKTSIPAIAFSKTKGILFNLWLALIPAYNMKIFIQTFSEKPLTEKEEIFLFLRKFYSGILIPIGAFLSPALVADLIGEHNIRLQMHRILVSVSSYMKALERLSELLVKDKVIFKDKSLLNTMPSLQPLANFADNTKNSSKLNRLREMLKTDTFKGEASIFTFSSRVIAAYELMKQVKDELAPVIVAVGELDMYVACANLYNARLNKNNKYCFAQFVESTTPVLEAKNFWNAFIDPDTVVANDALFNNQNRNILLTGPNTGGKSTILKAIIIAVIMAQTFGIAPADSFTLTPFAKLNCFMNIADDIATGTSLFKAEVLRAKALLETIRSLKAHEFSLVIIDEVFTGTSPKEGEEAAFQFAIIIGQYPNSTNIIATHYPKMIDLEKETKGIFKNFHIEVVRNPDGSLKRTFKLKPGPTLMNVAFDILKEEGLFN